MAVFKQWVYAYPATDNLDDADLVCGIVVVPMACFSRMATRRKAVWPDSGKRRIADYPVRVPGFLCRSIAHQLPLAIAGLFSVDCRAAFFPDAEISTIEQESVFAGGDYRGKLQRAVAVG